MRVSPPRVFPVATGATKPPNDAAGSVDAFRQTGFVLGEEVGAVLEGLGIEGSIAEASSAPKFRTQNLAASLGLWSRSWLSRLQALHALQWGNYAASITLIRAAADHQAAMLALLKTDGLEWKEWLEAGAIAIDAEHHATQFRQHAFRSGEILATHELLGRVYRVSTDLSLSHFGSTLLFAGSGSAPDHVEMSFGDRDFHFGLAELLLGWLLELGSAQGGIVTEFDTVFASDANSALTAWTKRAKLTSDNPERCRIESVEVADESRYLVHNWRREPRSAPKRLLL